ncbi:hypothetical protein J437_LFUL008309 [Ladona fulva]|uniref:SSD domain-containing protein n=1 Tax=Ladona fulva TaxID=123851 RepID=A0A8K0KA22_LADFU|nr:hypothetical protein J437_LFUL008309 [Ladona fulva]
MMAGAFRGDVIHGGVASLGSGEVGRRRAGGGESGTESSAEGGGGRGCFGGSRELSVPDRVAQIFYSHGLFVSSHPWGVICFAISVVLLCCYPLVNLPLPGNVPQELLTPLTNYTVPGLRPLELGNLTNGTVSGKNSADSSMSEGQHPWWYRGSPIGYIQQIVVKSAVMPWTNDLILTDAFRAPLAEVFDLLEIIRNYQNLVRGRTLSQLCLHVEAVKTKSAQRQSMVLPEYNCLLLSPANLWQQDKGTFQADPTLLSTIFNYQSIQKGKISLAELLFGMNMKDTGIKRYPLRTRQRTVQYAVTLILKVYDPIYLDGLKQKLNSMYQPEPGKVSNLSGGGQNVGEGGEVAEGTTALIEESESILHIYYPGHFNLHRMLPLLAIYVVLFLYIYFSVRKMELVRSKLRFFLTFQEFCIFLVVGLLSDFFLQMMFFATVLAVDIRRLESLESHQRHHHHHNVYSSFQVENQHKGWHSADEDKGSSLFWPGLCFGQSSRPQKQKLSRSRSQPRLLNGGYPTDVVAPGGHSVTASPVVGGKKFASSALVAKLPKRLKLLYFWARTRIIQRMFMFGMVVWISVIVYNTGIVDRLAYVDQSSGGHEEAVAPPRNDSGKVSPPYSAGPFVSPVPEVSNDISFMLL